MLEHNVHPTPPRPEIEQMQRRSQEYKERVEQRFRETRKPGTIGGMGGGGSMGMHQGTPFGRQGFSYWDGTKLSCFLELSSGGGTVNYTEEFPITNAEAQSGPNR